MRKEEAISYPLPQIFRNRGDKVQDLILNIKALAMGAQEIIHGSEPVQGIHMVNIIDLSAHFLILIPFQRHAFVWIVPFGLPKTSGIFMR